MRSLYVGGETLNAYVYLFFMFLKNFVESFFYGFETCFVRVFLSLGLLGFYLIAWNEFNEDSSFVRYYFRNPLNSLFKEE